MPDKTYALAVRYTQLNAACENVLHFRKTTTGDPTDAQWLTLANAWKETIRPGQSDTVTYVDWVATQVLGDGVSFNTQNCRQIGGTLQSGLLTGTLGGSATGDALPPLVTTSVNVHTALRGRSYHTRLQISGFVETQITNGLWVVSFINGQQALLDTFRGVYGSGGTDPNFRWCTYSRGIASGCFPNPDLRHHPLEHRQEGQPENAIANVTSANYTRTASTTRSRII